MISGAFAFIFLLDIVLSIVCANIWKRKGGSAAVGFLLGFFLGIIGLIIVLLVNPGSTGSSGGARCPYCAEFVQAEARVCRHCGRDLPMRACPYCHNQFMATADRCPSCKHNSPPWRLHEGRWWKREDGVDLWYDDAAKTWQRFQQS
jgi:zinc ribbon protein